MPWRLASSSAALESLAVAGLHAVEAAAALGWDGGGVQEHVVHSTVESRHDAGDDEAAGAVDHEDDRIREVSGEDVGDHRGHLVVDRQRAEVGWLRTAAG